MLRGTGYSYLDVPDSPEMLADRRAIVLVLRLLIAPPGEVIYGEAVEMETRRRTQFRGWQGLHAALEVAVRGAIQRSRGVGKTGVEDR